MRFALINSGLGLLAAASHLHRLRPAADLILALDPDGMPWGPREPADIARRSLAMAHAAARYQPDVLVMACNTGTVHALELLRAEFEPGIPVVGTVPAIKPAAAAAASVAIWATEATTASEYQRRLIAEFGGAATVTAVACPALADGVDRGDERATAAAVGSAASRTPDDCGAIVLGCTEYELAASLIMAAVPDARLFGSAAAVAAQALRRTAADHHAARGHSGAAYAGPGATHTGPGAASASPGAPRAVNGERRPDGVAGGAWTAPAGTLRVLLSGRPGELPDTALRYPEGRTLAGMARARDRDLRPA